MIEILCRSEPGSLVLEVLGDLDASAGPVLASCFEAAMGSGATIVVVDVRQVGYIDPCVAGVLRATAARVKARDVSLSVRTGETAMPDERTAAPNATLDGRHHEAPGAAARRADARPPGLER